MRALALYFAAIAGLPAATVQFDKLVPFATADQVRVECVLRSPANISSLELTGTITDRQSGAELWRGNLGRTNMAGGLPQEFSRAITGLKPKLWSLQSPNLYELKISAALSGDGKPPIAEKSVRIGFRSFESRNGNFVLNGRPVFLRGLAINPPGRTVPPETGESRAFAEAYVQFLKSQNVNIIRLTHDSQVWFDVCDELGMLVYQGQYGSPLGSAELKQNAPLDVKQSISAYETLFETYARHPALVIYILSNELPVSGARGKAFHDFLTTAGAALKQWDPTRLIIGNAGYGEGREGDICDVHRYWGWYYNTFLTFYNLRDPKLFGDPAKNQPITFTECVGNFTGPSGEYNLIVRKQLGAQLNWTGHSPNQREDALAGQSFMVKQAAETFRRLRPINPRLSGLMPFTILFENWSGITAFEQMKPKPAMAQLALSYQPVLLSLEMWTPQVYAGAELHPVAHVINDADDGGALGDAVLRYEVVAAANGKSVSQSQSELKVPSIPYYGTWSTQLVVHLPGDLPTGDYRISGTIWKNGRLISTNSEPLFVAGEDWSAGTPLALEQPVALFDPAGHAAKALKRLNLPMGLATNLDAAISDARVLILGENSLSPNGTSSAATTRNASLRKFIEKGGRILCLRQEGAGFDGRWLPEPVTFFTTSPNAPTYPPRERPFGSHMNINPERADHPVFAGIDRKRLRLWSDYTQWNQTKAGFPAIYPVTSGFKLNNAESLERVAILADYDRGLEGVALCEMFSRGQGSVILCGFELVSRVGLDPAADRLLVNLVRYAASPDGHEPYPYVDSPIEWGNYASERGLITGPHNGLVLNAKWVRPATNPNATPLTQEEGAWNTRPGDQFVAHGRSPFGPYGYSTSSSLRDGDSTSTVGTGFFCARIPSGKTVMRTSLENPATTPAEIKINLSIHGSAASSPSQPLTIPGNSSKDISTPLPPGATNLKIQFTGSKSLVLLRTSFE